MSNKRQMPLIPASPNAVVRQPGIGIDPLQAQQSLQSQFPGASEQEIVSEAERLMRFQEAIRQREMASAFMGGTAQPEEMSHGGPVKGSRTSSMMSVPRRQEGGKVRGELRGINPNLHGMPNEVERSAPEEDTRAKISTAGRMSGLAQFDQNQARLALERAARNSVDPVTGLSQTPTSLEIDDLFQRLAAKGGDEGLRQLMLMQDYFNAKRSENPQALAEATRAVMDYKHRLNAGRGVQPYRVNEKGPEAFRPVGGQPQLIQGGEQIRTFPSDGKVIPANRTAQLMKQGKVAGSIPPGIEVTPGVESRDEFGNVNLGTGSIYNTGAGTKQLASKYGTGSSVVVPKAEAVPPNLQEGNMNLNIDPNQTLEPVSMQEGTIAESGVPQARQLAPSPYFDPKRRPFPTTPIEDVQQGAQKVAAIGQETARRVRPFLPWNLPRTASTMLGRKTRDLMNWATTPR